MPYDHPAALGALGATGTRAANVIARDADLVIAVGTRLGDFTTASRTAFQDPGAAPDRPQRGRRSTPTSWARSRSWATPAPGSRRWPRRSPAIASTPAIPSWPRGSTASGTPRWGGSTPAGTGRRPRPQVIGAVNDSARAARRGRLRGREHARRPAQALAHARPQGLPRRVRLLVHGLRGGRRPGREAGRSRPRGAGDGR